MSRRPTPVIRTPPDRAILVTGGAGFVGSALCRLFATDGAVRVIALDTADAGPALDPVADSPNFRFVAGDIADRALLAEIFAEEHVDSVLHLAGEAQVDRPSSGSPVFLETNVTGTFHLLEASLAHWRTLMPDQRERFRFLHVAAGTTEGPVSPLMASRLAADALVRAWHDSFGLPILLSTAATAYGPHQRPDAFIPTVIRSALANRPVQVPGNGADITDWLHVDDHAAALRTILYRGQVGETYPVAARAPHSMIAVAAMLCDLIDRIDPRPDGRKRRSLVGFVAEAVSDHRRAGVDPDKTERLLGWRPLIGFRDGLIAEIDRCRRVQREGGPAWADQAAAVASFG